MYWRLIQMTTPLIAHSPKGVCIGKSSLASEGTLPTNDGLLGCELEAVHDVVVLDLSLYIRQYLPPNPTPLV